MAVRPAKAVVVHQQGPWLSFLCSWQEGSITDQNGSRRSTLTPSLIRTPLVNMNAGDKQSDGGLGQSLWASAAAAAAVVVVTS